MIFWSGFGFLVPVIAIGCFVLAELVTEFAFSDENYYQEHTWPMALAFAVAALVVTLVARSMDPKPREVVDEQTGERVVVRGARHTFFFVPIRYWSAILIVIGVLSLV